MIPPFDDCTGGLPPGDHVATLTEIEGQLGFSTRRRWLLHGLRTAVESFWAAGIEDIFIDGSFCTTKPDPGDIDGYWVEPDPLVYDRIDPYWIDFEMVFIPKVRKMRWRMWVAAWCRENREGAEIMIKTDAQRGRTVAQIDGFRRALGEQASSGKRAQAIRGSYEGMIRQLEEEVEEYDKLKAGSVVIPPLERLDQIAPFIVRLRIAKGVSQTELASRLGVSKQVVSRNEDDDYQGVGLEKLQSILDALGVHASIRLSA